MAFWFLPPLFTDNNIPVIDYPGRWQVYSPRTVLKVASELDRWEFGDPSIAATSIPSIWSRALLVETALHNHSYPLRDLIIEQWQGMLAALALADVRQFDIKVQYVNLYDYTNNDYVKKNSSADLFALALYENLPQPTYALYQLDGKPHSQYNPWAELYVFLWNSQSEGSEDQDKGYRVVGISSPSTLVCPAEGGKWTGLDWCDNKGRLCSPINDLNSEEKVWLSLWLEKIIQELPKYYDSYIDEGAIDRINYLLHDFRDSLKVNPSRRKLRQITKIDYFGTQINRGALELLNSPISLPDTNRVSI